MSKDRLKNINTCAECVTEKKDCPYPGAYNCKDLAHLACDEKFEQTKKWSKKMNKKKGYVVQGIDDDFGIAVIATNIKEAKKIGFTELDCDWIDVRAKQSKDANSLDSLSVGVVNDIFTAWRHGIFDWVSDPTEGTCDVCHDEIPNYRLDNKIVCEFCYEGK